MAGRKGPPGWGVGGFRTVTRNEGQSGLSPWGAGEGGGSNRLANIQDGSAFGGGGGSGVNPLKGMNKAQVLALQKRPPRPKAVGPKPASIVPR